MSNRKGDRLAMCVAHLMGRKPPTLWESRGPRSSGSGSAAHPTACTRGRSCRRGGGGRGRRQGREAGVG